MKTMWPFLLVGAVIAVSIVSELAKGESGLRGIGRFSRQKEGGKFWLSILLKAFILFAVLALGYLQQT